MTTFFERRAMDSFAQCTCEMLRILAEEFPSCEQTKEAHLYFQNVVIPSAAQIKDNLDSWYDHMQTPLSHKKTKYAKAVERVSGTPAVAYHAVAYRDLESLQTSITSGTASKIGLFSKGANLDPTKREHMWKLIDMINTACFEVRGVAPPNVPTRDAIQANIATRNAEKQKNATAAAPDGPSMTNSFVADFNRLAELWGAPSPLDPNDPEGRQAMERWSAFARMEVDGQSMRALCASRDGTAVRAALRASFSELSVPDDALSDEAWETVQRLNDISTVVKNVPRGMMTQIESIAGQLARDMQSGKMDLSQLDLANLGERVLSNCTETDMSQFAGSIDSLLPVVQSISRQQGLGGMMPFTTPDAGRGAVEPR
jgi:hypothetical protein